MPPADAAAEELDEVEASGERPGPGLWKVSLGEHSLYVLATLTPLPRRMTWRSQEVERVLAQAQQFVPARTSVDVKVGPIKALRLYAQWRRSRQNADGATLVQVLPPDLYARYAVLRDRYAPRDSGLESRRPIVAAAMLYEKSVEAMQLRLSDEVDISLRRLARRQRVPIADIEQRLEDPSAALADLATISPEAERACFAATIERLETDLESMRRRAQAWAVGDVAALRTQSGVDQEAACWGAVYSAPRLADFARKLDELWFRTVLDSLERNAVTLAAVPIRRLLERGGVLDRLRARGAVIVEP